MKSVVAAITSIGTEEAVKGFKVPEGMKLIVVTKYSLGGKLVTALVPKDVTGENLGKIKFSMLNDGAANANLNMDMAAAEPGVVGEIATAVGTAADLLIEEKKEVSKLEKAFAGVTDGIKRAQGNAKDEAKDRTKKAAKVVKAILGLTTVPFVQARQNTLVSLNAALSYGAASLNVAKA